jgi:lipopolysaccharide export system protein LptA
LLNATYLSLLLATPMISHAESGDRDKPIDLEADSVEVDDAKGTSTYKGNVILIQGTLVIRADKLIVQEDKEGFQHSTSLGNPTTFKQKRDGKNEFMEGSAQRIEYDGRMDKVKLYTKAWVKRGEDIVHGDYIMYDAVAEFAEVLGGTKSETNTTGRVRAIIQPKSKKTAE